MTNIFYIAAPSGYFGTAKDRKGERAVAPFAVYKVVGSRAVFIGKKTAEEAVKSAERLAAMRGCEWDDRTKEEAS